MYIFSLLVQLSDTKSDFYGHSDRRGAINKSTKLFTRAELREMLKKIKDDSPEVVPLLTSTGPSQGINNTTPKQLAIFIMSRFCLIYSETLQTSYYIRRTERNVNISCRN